MKQSSRDRPKKNHRETHRAAMASALPRPAQSGRGGGKPSHKVRAEGCFSSLGHESVPSPLPQPPPSTDMRFWSRCWGGEGTSLQLWSREGGLAYCEVGLVGWSHPLAAGLPWGGHRQDKAGHVTYTQGQRKSFPQNGPRDLILPCGYFL